MLKGQVAVVTGGSRGIGKAVCEELASMGADIVVNYAGNEKAALDTCAACEEMGVKAIAIKANVSESLEVEAMMKQVMTEFGRIDILVNNAGIARDGLLLRMSEEDFDAVIDINLKGAFLCMKHVNRIMMKQRYGRIINMSSVVGINGNAGQMNYAASKAGLIGMTKSMAKEMASRGITVNAIAPGFIKTDMTDSLPEAVTEGAIKSIPLARLGEASDIAKTVGFFVCKSSGYITGQVLCVDGGMAM